MRRKLKPGGGLRRDERGATAAEFALVLGPLIMLTLGSINVSVMIYTVATLHFAVEDTARWAAIQTTVGSGTPPTAIAVQAHGVSAYKGPATVTFTRDGAAACGLKITGTADYVFTTGLTSSVVPLSATACYPQA